MPTTLPLLMRCFLIWMHFSLGKTCLAHFIRKLDMKPRKGTKANPFKVGERVEIRATVTLSPEGREGVVLEVVSEDAPEKWCGDRGWSPIRYLVHEDTGGLTWYYARDLNAIS